MTTFDFSPLYRSAIGFDRLANLLSNIEVTGEDEYRITMAVAGFADADIEITCEQNKLTVLGSKKGSKDESEYLYRGIAERSFERRFQLADYVRVTGARLEHGMLHIDLYRELPDAMKPQIIKIAGASGKLIEGSAEEQQNAA